MLIDIHTHCFPDEIAKYAIDKLQNIAKGKVNAVLDGTVKSLLKSMEHSKIDVSVIQHIATKPGQEKTINTWAASIQDERLYSFGAIHPDTVDLQGEVNRIVDLGLKGVKFHPEYQSFFVEEKRMFPLYEMLCQVKLPILFHCGIDVGFPEPCHCRPAGLRQVVEQFPEGKWIAAHMGGWRLWDEVAEHLIGLPIYLDTSFCLPFISITMIEDLIKRHGVDRILYGSDSPWYGQRESLNLLLNLQLSQEDKAKILGNNAADLLNAKK